LYTTSGHAQWIANHCLSTAEATVTAVASHFSTPNFHNSRFLNPKFGALGSPYQLLR
jgi:hypothetical protein